MCRWIVFRGRQLWLCDVVTKPSHGLIRQAYERYLPSIHENTKQSLQTSTVEVNSKINADGFGIGWYTASAQGPENPCTFHSITPAPNNRNLRILCDHVQTQLLFGHIRASSGSAIAENNCHPFVNGRWMFMHNGAIARFLRIKRILGQKLSKEVFYAIEGTTDSEYAFSLFLDILGEERLKENVSLEKVTQAFMRTIQIIVQLVYTVEESQETHIHSSLNFAVSNGKIVLASRFRDGPDDPPSLYYHDKGLYKCDDQGSVHVEIIEDTSKSDVLIGSEPLTLHETDWTLVDKNTILICNEENTISLLPIKDERPSQDDKYWWT